MEYSQFFQLAKEKGITNLQITEKHTINSSVEIIDGRIDSYDDTDDKSYSIKAEFNNKTVKSRSNYLSADILDTIIMKAKETDSEYQDEYLIKNENHSPNKPLEIDISNELKKLKEIKKWKEKYPLLMKLTTYYSEKYQNTRIINSNGVDISTDTHLCSLIVEAIIENKENRVSFDKKLLTTNKKEIKFDEFIQNIIEKAIIQSTREKLETRKYDIVLDPSVSGSILEKIATMLSATSIRNKVSCLENALNEQIFNERLTVIEDPTNKNYPGYRFFDDEGTITKKKNIIEKGKILSFLYNVKEAKIKNIDSTGNGYSGIETRNMYVLPGKVSEEEIIKKVKDGIYITDYMGASGTSINCVNGGISLQVFGFRIKDGKIISGIEPAIMTTTIFELYSNIAEIGKELVFTNIFSASPTILIKDISIVS